MNAGQPLVTIAIPTYNRAATYLGDALGCALVQTYRNLDIIVADNCSSDATPQFVQAHTDSRVRYFRHERNLAPNDNFNFCLQQARGEYFLLLLDDEQVDPDFVATCIEAARGDVDIGLIRTGLRTIDAKGAVIGEQPNGAAGVTADQLFIAWFENRTALYLCNTLFNTAALRSVGGFRSRHNLFQDVMAQVRLIARLPRIDVATVKASTRSHSGQFTYSAKVINWAEDSADLLALMENAVPDKREVIRKTGEPFFAAICYSRAGMIRSPMERAGAYRRVYRYFGRRYLPRLRTVLVGTALYRGLRALKRRLKGQPGWAAAG